MGRDGSGWCVVCDVISWAGVRRDRRGWDEMKWRGMEWDGVV